MVKQAVDAAKILAAEDKSARVVNMHTIKPIDKEMVIDCARKTNRIVVCEEHMTTGGLAAAVSGVLAEENPVRIERIGVKNRFGQSGSPAELMKEYHLTAEDIVKACRRLLNKRS